MILEVHDIGYLSTTTISDELYVIILGAIDYTYYYCYSFPDNWHIKEIA